MSGAAVLNLVLYMLSVSSDHDSHALDPKSSEHKNEMTTSDL